MLPTLEAAIRSAGFRSEEGGWAWPREFALRAIAAARGQSIAVTLLEAWLVLDQPEYNNTHARVVNTSWTDYKTYSWVNEIDWDMAVEPWDEFLDRSHAAAVAWLASVSPEEEVLQDFRRNLFIHVEFRSRVDYEAGE